MIEGVQKNIPELDQFSRFVGAASFSLKGSSCLQLSGQVNAGEIGVYSRRAGCGVRRLIEGGEEFVQRGAEGCAKRVKLFQLSCSTIGMFGDIAVRIHSPAVGGGNCLALQLPAGNIILKQIDVGAGKASKAGFEIGEQVALPPVGRAQGKGPTGAA